MKSRLLTFCLLGTILLSPAILSQGIWTQRANFAGTGRYFPAAFSIGSKGYVGTGCIGGQGSKDFWEYNPTTDSWTQKATYAGTATYAAVGFSIGLKGYIQTRDYLEFFEYDPSANTWIKKNNPPTTKYGAVGFSIGNKGYIGTGDENDQINDFWEYDPQLDTWTQKAAYGGGIRSFAAGFSIGPKGYIGTGRSGGDQKDFWEYDPSLNQWTQKADFAGGPTSYACAFAIGGKGYVGKDGSPSFWEYVPATNTWNSIAAFPGGSIQTTTGFSIGNKGYIVCGQFNSGRDLWEFDPQDTSLNLLTGTVFSDANANCIMDGPDAPIENWFVKAQSTSSSSTLYGSTNALGLYKIWVPIGTYSVSLIPKLYWGLVCPSGSYLQAVAGQDTVNNLNFGTTILNYCPDLAVSIGASTTRRCLKNNYSVQYWNNGTTPASNALLKIDFDNPQGRIIPLSSTIPWDSSDGTKYFWKVGSLLPGQFVSFTITDSISCNAQLGDQLGAYAMWLNTPADCNFENNVDEDIHIVTGSFDPNEKEAYTTSNPAYMHQANIYSNDTINYTIHFQNTGSDTAFTVTIYDTLDSHLDPASVISGASSHAYKFELLGMGVLKWTFSNILLPDSNINELASHGFVKFRILQDPNNPSGTVIKNHAVIAFDFNTPVITNNVDLTVSPHTPTAVEENGQNNSLSISPNPGTGIFVIKNETALSTVKVYSVLGELVHTITTQGSQTTADLTHLQPGIYLIQVQTEQGILTRKLIKN